MRLRRLDLSRYGRFTDHVLDFGERGDGPDLHVVYGPNEAGKSTLFNGFLDLLYGMGTQSAYGFLHPYATMRLAAALEFDGAAREVVRIKKPANSLQDAAGRVLPEAVVSSALGGIGRDAYRAMFSLDDDSLEGGGKAILDSRGDLGELLFSATAGLADFGRRLVEVRAKADGFYRYRAQSGELIALKAKLAALKGEREAIDMGAQEFTRLVEARDAASRLYADAVAARAARQARLDAASAALGALPRLGHLKDLRGRLAPLKHLPAPPPDWSNEAPALSVESAALAAALEATDAEIGRLRSEAEALTVDEPALAAAPRMAALGRLRPRAETAGQDLPRSRLAIAGEEAAIADALARIGKPGEPDPRRLLVPIATAAAFRTAIEARSGVAASLEAAARARALAEAKLADARRRLEDHAGVIGDHEVSCAGLERRVALEALDAAARAAQASDHVLRSRAADRAARDASDGLLRLGEAAMVPAGDLADLRSRTVPTAGEIAAWKVAEAALEADLARLEAEEARLAAEKERREGERRALTRSGALVSDAELAELRTRRERAWTEHRGSLAAATADVFESAMRRDDAAVASRSADADDHARLRRLDEDLERAAADLSTLHCGLGRNRERAARHGDDLAAAWRRAGVAEPPDGGVGALEAWLAWREGMLAARSSLAEAERLGLEAARDGASLATRLRGALLRAQVAAADDDPLDLLLARSRAGLDAEAEAKGLRAAVAERLAEAAQLRDAHEKALRAEAEWDEAWAGACSTCWLGEDGGPPAPDAVRETLAGLATLDAALGRRAGWADRIGKMERDVDAFAHEVAAIAALLGEPVAGIDPIALADGLAARVGAAGDVAAVLRRVDASLKQVEGRRRDLAERLDRNARRRGEMAGFFGVADLAEVETCLARVADRSKLEAEAAATAAEILTMVGLDDLARAEAVLAGLDREALAVERAELKARIEDEDKRCHELFATAAAAADRVEAVGGDARAAAIEAGRRTVLLEIEDGALRYLRLRAGVSALEQALRLYKEGHRGSMLDKASKAFATMSGGAYAGLRTQSWKDREVLIAIARDGSSKEAEQLSKGTRFQLYLSLRAAGYLEYAGIRTPPPFVADDIMETFDDFRAEEALKVFARMAEAGQVVYLTHHRHLLPIARAVCPGAKIHELSAAGRSAA